MCSEVIEYRRLVAIHSGKEYIIKDQRGRLGLLNMETGKIELISRETFEVFLRNWFKNEYGNSA